MIIVVDTTKLAVQAIRLCYQLLKLQQKLQNLLGVMGPNSVGVNGIILCLRSKWDLHCQD